ncbi:MAG: class II aldolase/adducin family protein [Pseudomonadota bacterium]|jgi:ribulose-5-phosphate 4-epimerase/fuculose-1-phosphate aldolase|nr:class II aldolase/adducin family protein [Alphaproteobacteria bacterium]
MRQNISEIEWNTRLELTAAYHLAGKFGWTDLIYTHFTARVPGEEGCFLINPFGLHFHEITPTNLIKVNFNGEVISETEYEANPTSAVVHGTIHDVRPDVLCTLHLHTANGVAVSSTKDGLLPLSQHALHLYDEIAYHDYEGIALDEDEKVTIAHDLGDKKVMLMKNHGTLTAGASIPEAFMLMYMLEKAAEIQVKTLAQGLPICTIPKNVCERAYAQALAKRGKHLKLEWMALLRLLDTPYVRPLLNEEHPLANAA